MASDVPHRYATRSWPKALGSRLYGSLSLLLGIHSSRSPAARQSLSPLTNSADFALRRSGLEFEQRDDGDLFAVEVDALRAGKAARGLLP